MAFLSPAAEQDVYSIYLNLDACDPCDDYTTGDKNPQPLPPLEFSFLEPWHDVPITLPLLDPKGSPEAYWSMSSPLEPLSPMPINDFTLFSPIVPSPGCSPSTDWLLIGDEESVIQGDTSIPLIQRRSPSPPCLPVPHPMVDAYVKFTGAEQFDCLAPSISSSPSTGSVCLSGADSDYSNLFSPGTSVLTSPASSVSCLDDVRRSCSVSPETDSGLSSPSIRLNKKAVKTTNEDDASLITRNSRNSSLKGRRKQKRANPISSRRRPRQVLSGDPQDQDLSWQPGQLPYSVVVNENGKKRPVCPCGKSFTRISDLRRHFSDSKSCPFKKQLLENEERVDQRFTCTSCAQSFSRGDSLDRHLNNPDACERFRKLHKIGEYAGDEDD